MNLFRPLIAGLLAGSLLAGPVEAAIVRTDIGTAIDSTSVATKAITTTADCPAGSYVITALAITASSNWSVSLSSGDSMSGASNFTWNTTDHIVMSYGKIASDLPSGGTITWSWTTNGKPALAAICVSGLASSSPLDITGAGAGSAGSTSVSGLSTGTLTQASELVFAAWGVLATYGTWTEDSAFATGLFPTASSNTNIRITTDIVNATTSVPYAPSWVTSRANGANLWTFKADTGGTTNHNGLLLLGVGN